MAELLEEVDQRLLLGGREARDGAADDVGVAGEDAGDQGLAGFGELGVAGSAVGFAGAAADEAAFDELVDEEGDAAAGDEDLLLDFAEEHGALVVEGFEDGEFRLGEAVGFDVGFGVGVQRLRRPGEDDIEVQGAGVGRHLSVKINTFVVLRCLRSPPLIGIDLASGVLIAVRSRRLLTPDTQRTDLRNMPEKIVPSVNAEAEFFEILNDFGDPLEILREAISNAYDASATRMSIRFDVEEIDGAARLVIRIADNGRGIDESSLRQDFWGLGHSTSRGSADTIGEKGHGTKIYLRSEHVSVRTQTAAGAWLSECTNPLRRLAQRKLHEPTIQRIEPFLDGTGTEITVIGYNENERARFVEDVVTDYVHWFTKIGTVEHVFRDPAQSLEVSLKCLDSDPKILSFGHPFPEPSSSIDELFRERETEAADWFVMRELRKDQRLVTHPEVKYDVVISVEGDQVKRGYNPMIRDRRTKDGGRYKVSDRYGIWLCKDYIPVVRVNDWISGFGSGSNALTLLHGFVNCQQLKLTANRGTVANTNPQILEELKKAVQGIVDDVDAKLHKDGIYTLRAWQEEHRTVKQEKEEYARRVKSVRTRKSAMLRGTRLLEPANESEVFGLLIRLCTIVPELFPFEPLDYNTAKGIDLIARKRGVGGLETGDLWYVELKHTLRKDFNHSFGHIRWIVCWDFDKSIANGSEFQGVEETDHRSLVVENEDGKHLYFLDNRRRAAKIEVIRLREYLQEHLNLQFSLEPAE